MDHEILTIRRAINGDEAALRALWTRHAPHIDLVVRRLVGPDLDLAADIAQEVWIQIFRALPSYRGDAQFGTWAHRIAVNRTLNALRKTRRLASRGTRTKRSPPNWESRPAVRSHSYSRPVPSCANCSRTWSIRMPLEMSDY